MTSAEETAVDAARAAEAAEESVVEAKAAAAVSAEATEKSAEKGKHAVWSNHIAENQKMEKQAATPEEAAGDPAVAGEAAVDLVEAAEAEEADEAEEAAFSVGDAWKQMWWWVNKEWADYDTECEQNMLIDFEQVGGSWTAKYWMVVAET